MACPYKHDGPCIDDGTTKCICGCSSCRGAPPELTKKTNAIIDAIDRLTAAVLATAGRDDPDDGRCKKLVSGFRCAIRDGHGGPCDL